MFQGKEGTIRSKEAQCCLVCYKQELKFSVLVVWALMEVFGLVDCLLGWGDGEPWKMVFGKGQNLQFYFVELQWSKEKAN